MSKFEEYSRSYRLIKMERRGGILQMSTHPLRKQLEEGLQYFLAMEALSTLDRGQA